MKMTAGEKYQVTVESIIPIGAVVRMPNGSTELIHISQIAQCFVDNVENFVEVGQTLEAEVVENQGKKPIQLSLKHLGLTNSHKHPKVERPKREESNTPAENTSKEVDKPMRNSKPAPSLDDMIKKAQRDLEDKGIDKPKPQRRKG